MRYRAIAVILIVFALVGCDSEDRVDTFFAEKLNARGMDDLVKDAVEGRTRYIGETLTIKATVKDTSTLERLGYLTIETDHPEIEFSVEMGDLPYEKWKKYREGKTHTFTLLITGIGRNPDRLYVKVDYNYYISARIVT